MPLALLGLLSVACGPEFEPYFRVSELRVMAIGADKPSLPPNEAATFEVLTFEPADAALTYQWSWCPFSAGSTTGYECAVTEEEINGALAMAGLSLPPFDMGTGPTATLSYPDPPEVVPFMCNLLLQQELPDFFTPPDCSRGIPVLIKVVISGGGQTVTAVREIELLVNDQVEPNFNPSFANLRAIPIGGVEEVDGFAIEESGATVFERGERYAILVDIPEEASETFERIEPGSPPTDTKEVLVVSWFVEGGDLENERTGFIEGESTLFEAGRNVWTVPVSDDFEATDAALFLVLRDERGGITWLSRQVQLSP